METQTKLNIALEIVREAGFIALKYFNGIKNIKIHEKEAFDFVSEADIAVEQYIKSRLHEKFPADGFIGEESAYAERKKTPSANNELGDLSDTAKIDPDVPGYWVLDPIDGTSNFINQLHYWCISLAYYDTSKNAPTIGIIHQPSQKRLFSTHRGHGVLQNGFPLETIKRSLSPLEKKYAVIGVGTSSQAPAELDVAILTFIKKHHWSYRKLSCCALMLTEVVRGSYRGYFEPRINSWDCLAGILMVQEVGGLVNDFLSHNGLFDGNVLLAGTPDHYNQLKPLLTEIPRS